MSIRILQGDVMATLPQIPPGSVDVVCTSPPYWMLRSYLPKGHPLKPLELGSEPTPAAYVESMVKVFRLVRTAMADHAVCWLNIGDTYSANSSTSATWEGPGDGVYSRRRSRNVTDKKVFPGIDAGSLCLIPQRLAIALSDDGWIVRSVVVWHKPSPMPASVAGWRWARCRVKVGNNGRGQARRGQGTATGRTAQFSNHSGNTVFPDAQWQDCPGCPKCEPNQGYVLRRGSWRPTSAWEPILMLAKGPGYFCDGEACKVPAAYGYRHHSGPMVSGTENGDGHRSTLGTVSGGGGPGSVANLRDVWTIAAEPLKEKHYAAFPSELVLRCLRAGTSARGYCPACGMPWCRVVETKQGVVKTGPKANGRIEEGLASTHTTLSSGTPGDTKTLGWKQSCKCPEQEPRPGVVLDPFCGSGRTGLVARQLGLDFVGCELNPAYVEMAKRLLVESSPLFNQVES